MIDSFRGKAMGWSRALRAIPVTYAMIVPLVFLDLVTRLYHAVCFPLYGIPRVDRRAFVRDSRGRLPYLSDLDRFHCWYCGYANGVLHYATEVAARTERYWCPIKQTLNDFRAPAHHADFAEHGDEKGLTERLASYPPKE